MKNKRFGSFLFFAVLIVISVPVFCGPEKSIILNGKELWDKVTVINNVTSLRGIRPAQVILLTSSKKVQAPNSDLVLNFDEFEVSAYHDVMANYELISTKAVNVAPQRYARIGLGAALFSGDMAVSYLAGSGNTSGPLTLRAKNNTAVFSSNNIVGSFSIEFYLYPNTLETGEEIITWNATNVKNSTVQSDPFKNQRSDFFSGNYIQNFNFTVSKNRPGWTFTNFFTKVDHTKSFDRSGQTAQTGQTKSFDVKLNGRDKLTPKTWSHHILRYDEETGYLEYVMNGITQDVKILKEGNDIFSPVTGDRGSLVLGKNFNGMLDDFKVFGNYLEETSMARYPASGGRIESHPIDLGAPDAKLLRIEVSGGRVNAVKGGVNEPQKNGDFIFKDDSQIQFFVRISNSPYTLNNKSWEIFKPGGSFHNMAGRYVQFAADLYPSGTCENTPYIEEIKFIHDDENLPMIPGALFAKAKDGSVELSWKNDPRSGGYVIYYGFSSGVYFCEDALQGASPLDVGHSLDSDASSISTSQSTTNRITLNGLKNGVLYYFAVCSYNAERTIQSEFSREVRARPMRSNE